MEGLHDMSQAEHHLERSILWGIYAILATPFLFSNDFLFPTMTPKLLWLFLFAEVTCVLSVWLWFTKPLTRPKFSLPVLSFFLFLVVMAVASLTGVYPQNSFWGSLETNTSLLVWIHVGLVLMSLLTVARSPQAWTKVAIASTVIGLCVSLLHLISLFPESIIIGFNSGSTLGNSSFLGTYLLFELFFAGLLIVQANGRMKAFGIFSVLAFLFTLFSTDAMGAMLSAVGASVLLASLLLLTSKRIFQRVIDAGIVLALGLGFLCAVVLAYQEDSSLHAWIIEHSSGSRFVVADIAWEAFLERPVLGWGSENFRFAFLSHFDPCFGGPYCGDNILFDRAHNVFFDWLVTVGLLGTLVYAAVWGGMLRILCQGVRRKTMPVPTAALTVSLLAAYLVQNVTATRLSLLLCSPAVSGSCKRESRYDEFQHSHAF